MKGIQMQQLSRTEIENGIKSHSDESWLTPSQNELYKGVRSFVGGIDRVINIYGPQGCGKTFIAHIMVKLNIAAYITSLDQICLSSLPLLIDNAPFERSAVRGVRNQMRKFELHQVILISRYRAEDSIPTFYLSLNPDDIKFFRATLFRKFDLRLPDNTSLNLWDHLKLIGGTNA
jgi:hypothetical protein